MSKRGVFCLVTMVGLFGQCGWAQEAQAGKKDAAKPAAKAPPKNVMPPTFADVSYGEHERQVIDWRIHA